MQAALAFSAGSERYTRIRSECTARMAGIDYTMNLVYQHVSHYTYTCTYRMDGIEVQPLSCAACIGRRREWRILAMSTPDSGPFCWTPCSYFLYFFNYDNRV